MGMRAKMLAEMGKASTEAIKNSIKLEAFAKRIAGLPLSEKIGKLNFLFLRGVHQPELEGALRLLGLQIECREGYKYILHPSSYPGSIEFYLNELPGVLREYAKVCDAPLEELMELALVVKYWGEYLEWRLKNGC